jgi:leukotriene-A4 hydrolase
MAASLYEFGQLGEWLTGAATYLTPYDWPAYNLLLLPPSFPYGGMENPMLTFTSPTLLVGDRSLCYVSIHEICHSWTGNDVTCSDWSNLWLNEGFTVFGERKVSEVQYTTNFALTEAFVGSVSLYHVIRGLGVDHMYTSLHPEFDGDAPDNYISDVPYEKGF